MTATMAPVTIGHPSDRYWLRHYPTNCHVQVNTKVRLSDFEPPEITRPEDMRLLRRLGVELEDVVVTELSSTIKGGGVAMINMVQEPLANEVGPNWRWRVIIGDEAFFAITKMIHNESQMVRGGGLLTKAMKDYYWEITRQNALRLRDELMSSDLVIIHDPQVAGIIWFLRQWGYKGKLAYRNHIQTHGKEMCTPGTLQEVIWRFLRDECLVSTVDAYIAHPVPGFVPTDMPAEKVWFIPATYTKIDDLNRPITRKESEAGFAFINAQLAENEGQSPIDRSKPYILDFARFDWAKGFDLAMEHYARTRALSIKKGVPQEEIPDLVILGNGSLDDGDYKVVLPYMMDLRRTKYTAIMEHIKIARVPHNDLAVNAVMRGAWLYWQTSTMEGLETRVSDAIDKGITAIGTTGTGIPTQILVGLSGFVFAPDAHDEWAACTVDLLTDKAKYKKLRRTTRKAAKTHNYDFSTIPGLISWLYLTYLLVNDRMPAGNLQWLLHAAREDVELMDLAA